MTRGCHMRDQEALCLCCLDDEAPRPPPSLHTRSLRPYLACLLKFLVRSIVLQGHSSYHRVLLALLCMMRERSFGFVMSCVQGRRMRGHFAPRRPAVKSGDAGSRAPLLHATPFITHHHTQNHGVGSSSTRSDGVGRGALHVGLGVRPASRSHRGHRTGDHRRRRRGRRGDMQLLPRRAD